jgi:hypothetical protein
MAASVRETPGSGHAEEDVAALRAGSGVENQCPSPHATKLPGRDDCLLDIGKTKSRPAAMPNAWTSHAAETHRILMSAEYG